MEVYSTVQKSICQQISDLLCQQTELTDQERVAVMSQFINVSVFSFIAICVSVFI